MKTIGFKNRLISSHTGKKILKYGFFYGIWFYLCTPILLRAIYSNDIYKALYSGRYLSWFGQFPHHSTFTFNRTLDVLNRDSFNWLGNLILYESQTLLGYPGLLILRGLLVVLVLLMIHSILKWRLTPITLIFLAILPFAFGQKLLLRTALYAVPLTVVLFWMWNRVQHRNQHQWIWGYPCVLLLWSQLHGSYQMGIGLTGVLFFGEAIQRLIQRKIGAGFVFRYGLVLFLVVFSVTFVSPFPDYSFLKRSSGILKLTHSQTGRSSTGIRQGAPGNPEGVPLLQEALRDYFGGNFRTVFDRERSDDTFGGQAQSFLQNLLFEPQDFRSGEFDFPLDHMDRLFVQTSLILLIVGLLSFFLPGSQCRYPLLFSVLSAGLLGLAYARTVAYIPLVVGPVLAIKTNAGDFKSLAELVDKYYIRLVSILLISGSTGIIGGLILTDNLQLLTGIPGHQLGAHSRYSSSSDFVQEIRDQYRQARFYNNYNPGAFLIWEWWPYKKVFVDSKWSAYDPEFRDRLIHTPLPKFLKQESIDYAITNDQSHWPLYFDRSDQWSLIDDNGQFFVFKRIETPQKSGRSS